MKTCLAIVLLMYGMIFSVKGQVTVTNKGVSISVTKGEIYFNGNYIHDSTSTIANAGTIYFRNDITNISDNRLFVTDSGKVIIDGIETQRIAGDTVVDFYKMEIRKPLNNLVLENNIAVKDTLLLVKGNIDLNGNEIDLRTNGELVGEEEKRRVFGAEGKIKARRFIQNTSLSENQAGLGLYLSTKDNFSEVVIERGHEQQVSNGDTSIYRYYNFLPLNSNTGLIDSLKFTYFNAEMAGQEYLYKIFSSANDGVEWHNKGGLVDTNGNYVLTTTLSPPELGKFRASVFPIESFATCLPNDPNYISAVFLVSTTAMSGDSVKFVQLTNPDVTDFSWNFGDGSTSFEFSPFHVYQLNEPVKEEAFSVSMTLTNGVCSDTRKKTILVQPKPPLRVGYTFSGIEFYSVYPNPSTGLFNVKVKTTEEEDISITVSDTQGRPLKQKKLSGSDYEDIFNLQEYTSGIYYIRLQVRDEVRVIKMVKL